MPDDITTSDATTSEPTAADTTADRAAAASDKLWAALHARPGQTAEELATDAGIGRSTAAKILTRWVDDGTVERTPGPRQGKRTGASRFAIAPPDPAPTATTPADTPDGGTDPHSGTDDGTDDGTGNGAVTDDDGADDSNAAPAGAGGDHDTVADGAVDTGGPTQAALVAGDESVSTTPSPEARSTTRLAPGALHGMVEDYLRDHPADEFGPTKIGHDLGRSSGAVSNALERLVTSGCAVRTSDRPKRYRLAAASADPAPEGGPEPI